MVDSYRVSDPAGSAALRRLDHVICEVPDIHEALDYFHERLGFPVAWPIGRYWTWGLTCGVSLGGMNLEFLQPDERRFQKATIRRLAFEPTTLEAARAGFERLSIPYEVQEKIETDPALLRLRGWDEEAARRPERLCTNLFPDRSRIAWDYFVCEYAPFQRDRLAPAAFETPGRNRVVEVCCGTPKTWEAAQEITKLGLEDRKTSPEVTFVPHHEDEVVEIRMANGPLDLRGFESDFRFV